MASNSFNYNQLNLVARDAAAVEIIQKALVKNLETLKTNVSVNGEAFKKVVSVANEVWSGADKDLFIKNLTSSANEFTSTISTTLDNLKRYLPQDVKDFNTLQSSTTQIANKKY